jgi:hypothetical protein
VKKHNAHMLIPKRIWNRIERRARIEERSKTSIVCEALTDYLDKQETENKR